MQKFKIKYACFAFKFKSSGLLFRLFSGWEDTNSGVSIHLTLKINNIVLPGISKMVVVKLRSKNNEQY